MQQRVQVIRDSRACLLDWARIAPAQTSAIEPTGPRELSNLPLEQQIAIARCRPARVQNHGRTTFARTINVERTPANIHRAANLRKTFAVLSLTNLFVRDSHKIGRASCRERG